MPVPSPLRIAHFIDSLGSGGTQTALLHLVRGLADRGHEQVVYCLNDRVRPLLAPSFKALAVPVVMIGMSRILTGAALPFAWNRLRRQRPHVVQTMLPHADVLGRLAGRLSGVPAVVSSIRGRHSSKRWWQFALDRLTAPLADAVVFNSPHLQAFSFANEGITEAQARIIPNGVRIPQAPVTATDLAPGKTVIGAVGRLAPEKGHDVLLRAFATLRDAKPDVALLLVGDGPEMHRLRTVSQSLGITDDVLFAGERNDVPALLAGMDVFVQPSLAEGMPNALLEAMAAALPAVASDIDGIRALLEHGRTGLLAPAGDAHGLGTALLSLLSDPSAAQDMGRRAARHVREHHSLEAMVLSFERLYSELSCHGA